MVFRFESETDAIEALKFIREKQGIKCPKCKRITPHRFNEKRKSWFCKCGKSETGLKARTVLHNSKLPIHFYLNILLDISENPGNLSIKELQRRHGHKYYPPVWRFFHKVGSILNITQGEEIKNIRNSTIIQSEVSLLTKYLGTNIKNTETNDLQEEKKGNMKTNSFSRSRFDNLPITIKAFVKTNSSNEADYNWSRFVIDKNPERWRLYGEAKIKDIAKSGLITKSKVLLRLFHNQSKPNYIHPDCNLKMDANRHIEKTLRNIYSKITTIHRRVDGDYMSSFLCHHTLPLKREKKKKGTSFLNYLIKNCFSKCWFDYNDYMPPHLERMGYFRLQLGN
jgi:hypothetical protein